MTPLNKITEITLGDFIKVTQTNGPTPDRLHLAGKVTMLCTETSRLEIQTTEGIIGIGWKMKGITLEVLKLNQKPKGWAAYMKNPHPPKSKPVVTKTIKERVFDLVKENPRKRLPGLVSLAKKEIGGSEASLTTNIQLALMKLNRLNPVK